MLCTHFTGHTDHATCGTCDVCHEPLRERAIDPVEAPAQILGTAEREVILAALGAHGRAVGKGTLAKALRGSRAKPVLTNGLDRISQHGALAACTEDDLVATMEALVRERRLVRRGRKFPTISLPAAVAARPRRTFVRRGRDGSSASSITVELDRFRKRMARELKWKPYMVFQNRTIAAIDRTRPDSLAALDRIPGLGAAKIARFGADLLAIIHRYG
jgi:superfamily II DNA helicase RecQ